MCSRVVNLACVRVWWPWHGVLVCCGALVWWTCHVFLCGGPRMCSRVVDLAWCSRVVAIRGYLGADMGQSGAIQGLGAMW